MIIKNYIYNALFQLLRIILPVVTMPYIARVLSAEGVGAYSVSAAWANFFMIVGMIGIDTYGSRQIAYARGDFDKLQKVFWEINLLKTISTLFNIVVYGGVIFALVRPSNICIYYIQIINLLSCTLDVSWYYAGIEDFKSTSVRNIFVKIISTIAIFIFVKTENDVWIYTMILCLGQFLGQTVLWKDIFEKMFPIQIPRLESLSFHLPKTVFLWIPSLAASLYNYLDKVMLGVFTNDYQVGIYDYSQNLVKIPATLIFAIATVTMPHVAADFANKNEKEASDVFYKSMRIVTMLALPMCFGFMAISENFVAWFLGDSYYEVGYLLKISAWVVLPISCSQIVGNQQIIAKGREKIYSIAICSGAVVNILLNLLFVKEYMAKGVLVASIIAEVVVLLLMIVFTAKDFSIKTAFSGIQNYIIASLLMYYIIKTISQVIKLQPFLFTVVQIIIGVLSYVVILALIRDKGAGFVYGYVRKNILK